MMRGAWLALAVAVLASCTAVVSWVGNDPRLSDTYGAFSTYNTSPSGLSQAYAYLAARRAEPNVRRLVREIAAERAPAAATIFRIGAAAVPLEPVPDREEDESAEDDPKKEGSPAKPAAKPRALEKLIGGDEEAWVRSGGRLVIGFATAYADLEADPVACGSYRSVFPVDPPLPGPDSPICRSLTGGGMRRFHSLVSTEHGPVLARWPLGAGDVIAFSMPHAFVNGEIDRGRNLELLERLAGENRVVYFDEMALGIGRQSSMWDLLVVDWRLGPAMVLLAAAAVASFWRRAKQAGPPERPDRDVRSEAIDLVQSLGQLYDRSVTRDQALRLYYQALARAVHARTGLSGDALDLAVRERARGYDPRPNLKEMSREEFQRKLAILNHAYETVGYANNR